MNKKFYITTAIPYVNGSPHLGHALEYFQADTLRNYHKLLGEETLLLSGADENALKNVQAAEKEGIPTQEFLDRNSQIFKDSYKNLDVSLDIFQRGSDQNKHWPGVQKLWNLCLESGDIYKKAYEGLYCVGCESFKTENELKDGFCPDHNKKPDIVKEENYFFKLSKYQDELLKLIDSNTFKISPANKRAEIISFIKSGLEDFSVSRSVERARGVGVPIPNDKNQVIYVWFDALDIYMTGLGFGTDEELWKKWWPADLHVIGKDISRFHTVYWPAMLLSAKLPLPKEVLVHSFIQSGGQKMSKTIGNVIDPFEMTKKYGVEPIRYYLLSQIPIDNDGDFTEERFKDIYNAHLANGLGNLVARVAKLCEKEGFEFGSDIWRFEEEPFEKIRKLLDQFKFNEAIGIIWGWISDLDKKIEADKPWVLAPEKLKLRLDDYVNQIRMISTALAPFLPETSEKILAQFTGPKIKSGEVLFPRIK